MGQHSLGSWDQFVGPSDLAGVWEGRAGCRPRLCVCPQVFIRELISNGSDALEKLRHRLMSEGKALPELEIHLQTDTAKGTITIQVGCPPLLLSSLPLSSEESLEAEQQQNRPQACPDILSSAGLWFFRL